MEKNSYFLFFSGCVNLVVGALVAVGAVILAVVIFKDEIANFISGGLTGAGTAVSESLGGIHTSIFGAGEEFGMAAAKEAAIKRAEAEIEKAAKDSGFESVEAFNKASDSGSIVIGGEKMIVDVGLIGDVLPSDPSPEFLANPEKFLTPEQLERFLAQQEEAKMLTETSIRATRFGGQSL